MQPLGNLQMCLIFLFMLFNSFLALRYTFIPYHFQYTRDINNFKIYVTTSGGMKQRSKTKIQVSYSQIFLCFSCGGGGVFSYVFVLLIVFFFIFVFILSNLQYKQYEVFTVSCFSVLYKSLQALGVCPKFITINHL